MKRIMIVEDEAAIREFEAINLKRVGYTVVEAGSGEEALEIYDSDSEGFDIALLDISMPGMDGFALCKELRKRSETLGIIMLTARTQEMDKISGLMLGADDYITKPFNILEVKARIKAIFRRMEPKKGSQENTGILESGDMKLDRDGRRAYIQNKEIGLTAKEFEVLELLMLNPDKVYSRESLLKLVWGTDYPGDVRTVDVHIRRLREKIESNPSEPRYVHTKWGVGYYFNGKLSHGQNA